MALMDAHPTWSDGALALAHPEPPAATPGEIDVDRLVWDQEYREEVRHRLKSRAGGRR